MVGFVVLFKEMRCTMRCSNKIWAGRRLPNTFSCVSRSAVAGGNWFWTILGLWGCRQRGWYENLTGSPTRRKELISFCSPQEEMATKTHIFGSFLGRIQTFRNVSCDPALRCVTEEKGCIGISTWIIQTGASHFPGGHNTVLQGQDKGWPLSVPNQSLGAANALTDHRQISIFFSSTDQLVALVTTSACISLSLPMSKND